MAQLSRYLLKLVLFHKEDHIIEITWTPEKGGETVLVRASGNHMNRLPKNQFG